MARNCKFAFLLSLSLLACPTYLWGQATAAAWRSDFEKGVRAFESSQFSVPEEKLIAALDAADDARSTSLETAPIHLALGSMFLRTGNYSQADTHLSNAISACRGGEIATRSIYVEAQHLRGRLHARMNEEAFAIFLFEDALDALGVQEGTRSQEANILLDLSRSLLNESNLASAIEISQRAKVLYESEKHANPERSALSRIDALLAFHQGETKSAERLLRDALNSQRAKPQIDPIEIAGTLTELARVLMALGSHKESMELLSEASNLTSREQLRLPALDHTIALSLAQCGALTDQPEKVDTHLTEAQNNDINDLQDAADLHLSHVTLDDNLLPEHLLALGDLCESMGEHELAKRFYLLALAAGQYIEADKGIFAEKIRDRLYKVHSHLCQFSAAKGYLGQVIEQNRERDQKSVNMLVLRRASASLAAGEGDRDGATTQLRRLIESPQLNSPAAKRLFLEATLQLGDLLVTQNHEEGLKHYQLVAEGNSPNDLKILAKWSIARILRKQAIAAENLDERNSILKTALAQSQSSFDSLKGIYCPCEPFYREVQDGLQTLLEENPELDGSKKIDFSDKCLLNETESEITIKERKSLLQKFRAAQEELSDELIQMLHQFPPSKIVSFDVEAQIVMARILSSLKGISVNTVPALLTSFYGRLSEHLRHLLEKPHLSKDDISHVFGHYDDLLLLCEDLCSSIGQFKFAADMVEGFLKDLAGSSKAELLPETWIRHGDLQLARGLANEAEQSFQKARKIQEEQFGAESPRLAAVWSRIAASNLARHAHETGRTNLETAIRLSEILGEDTNLLESARLHESSGDWHLAMLDYEGALIEFAEATQLLESCYGQSSSRLFGCRLKHAIALFLYNEIAEAEAALLELGGDLVRASPIPTRLHVDLLYWRNRIAQRKDQPSPEDQYRLAEELIVNPLAGSELAVTPKLAENSTDLSHLTRFQQVKLAQLLIAHGDHLLDRAEFTSAILKFEQAAQSLDSSVSNEFAVEAAMARRELATAWTQLGQLSKAKTMLEQALEAQKKMLGEKHPQVAITLHGLARIAMESNLLDDALKLLEQSATVLAPILPAEHESVLAIQTDTANVLFRKRKTDEAMAIVSSLVSGLSAVVARAEKDPQIIKSTWLDMIAESLRVDSKTEEDRIARRNRTSLFEQLVRMRYAQPYSMYDSLKAGNVQMANLFAPPTIQLAQYTFVLGKTWSDLGDRQKACQYLDKARWSVHYYLGRGLATLPRQDQVRFLEFRDREILDTALFIAAQGKANVETVARAAEWVINGKGVTTEILSRRIRDNDGRMATLRSLLAQRRERLRTSLSGALKSPFADSLDKSATLNETLANELEIAKEVAVNSQQDSIPGDGKSTPDYVALASSLRALQDVLEQDTRSSEQTASTDPQAANDPRVVIRKKLLASLQTLKIPSDTNPASLTTARATSGPDQDKQTTQQGIDRARAVRVVARCRSVLISNLRAYAHQLRQEAHNFRGISSSVASDINAKLSIVVRLDEAIKKVAELGSRLKTRETAITRRLSEQKLGVKSESASPRAEMVKVVQEYAVETQEKALRENEVRLFANKLATDLHGETLPSDPKYQDNKSFVTEMDALRQRATKLLDALAALGLIEETHSWITITQLRSTIPSDCVLLEFARARNWDKHLTKGQNSSRYFALLVPSVNRGDVRIIDLGNADELDRFANAYLDAITTGAANFEVFGKDLSERLLYPIESILPGTQNLIICPDGPLWRVPWAALIAKNNKFLIEERSLTMMISSRDLLRKTLSKSNTQRPAVFASPEYDEPCGKSEAGGFRTTSGMEVEATAFCNAFSAITGKPASEFSKELLNVGRGASESRLKAIEHPEQLLISSHGFWWAEPDWLAEYPLLRCGIPLAGANCPVIGNSEDGILWGQEVQDLDLEHSDLVILSACKTDTGDIVAGEGAVGLRQAFQWAGARTVLSTLWEVGDEPSATLVKHFVENRFQKKLSKAESLRQAQLAMLKGSSDSKWKIGLTRSDNIERVPIDPKVITNSVRINGALTSERHPYFWAGFTLTGEP
jgi:CHAT domain-containing protein/Tfp pilus assembly protein PilF